MNRIAVIALLIGLIGMTVFVGYALAPVDAVMFFLFASILIAITYFVSRAILAIFIPLVQLSIGIFRNTTSTNTDATSTENITTKHITNGIIYILLWTCSVCLFLAMPSISPTRKSDFQARLACMGRLHVISLAMQQYHNHYGTYPPPYLADENGRPLLSWRVLIIPFITREDYSDDYECIHLDEAWNSPHNRKCLEKFRGRNLYKCPAAMLNGPKNMDTNYLMILQDADHSPYNTKNSPDEQSKNKIVIAEVRESGIHWAEPKDLHISSMSYQINDPKTLGIGSFHRGLVHVLLNNGDIMYFLTEPPSEVKGIFIGTIDTDALEEEYINHYPLDAESEENQNTQQ